MKAIVRPSLSAGICYATALVVALFFAPERVLAQNWTWMYQCEACDTEQEASSLVRSKQRTGSNVYVFSLSGQKMHKFQSYFDQEFNVWVADPLPLEDQMQLAFQDMLDVEKIEPGFFGQGIRIIEIPIDSVSPGTDPVRASVEGSHSAVFNTLNTNLLNFLSNPSAMRQVSPLLAKLMSSIARLQSMGITGMIGSIGGNLSWEVRGTAVRLMLCTGGGDCAIYEISEDGNKVVYLGTFADHGRGAQYPLYSSSVDLTFRFDNANDANRFLLQLGSAGVDVIWNTGSTVRCGYVNGVLDSCRLVDQL